MRKLLFISTIIFLTVTFSSKSFAEWEYIITAGRGDTFYIDLETIKKVNTKLYYYELTNYPDHLEYNFKSDMFYYEVDCQTWLFKRYSGTYFSKEFGKGNIVGRERESEYIFARPKTVRRKMLEFVCSW